MLLGRASSSFPHDSKASTDVGCILAYTRFLPGSRVRIPHRQSGLKVELGLFLKTHWVDSSKSVPWFSHW